MRSVRSLLLFFVSFLFLGITFATVSTEEFIAGFETQKATLSPLQKEAYYKKVLANLNLLILKNRDNKEQFAVFTSFKDYVDTQILPVGSDIDSPALSSISFLSSGMTIPNVDIEKVREVWLTLHNTERAIQGLSPFIYSPVLEGTASTWANHLADIRTTSHKRKTTDGYYSYASIKKWFIGQGISFLGKEKNGQSLFTENIGWNMYTCKKTDCTDDFIKAIKKSRTFFMSEKYKNNKPHYNAIVGDFSLIGLGIGIVGNTYYLVTHYTVKF